MSQRPATRQIQHALSTFLAARLDDRRRLCVGFSGGRDSLVLLHALAGLRTVALDCELSAVHVHHGLSAAADTWAEFCVDVCRQLGVPLQIARVEVPRASREGVEGAARRLRHAMFAGCPADWVALAHHRDDQAETILFRLLRGAGVSGAAGMRAERAQAGGPRLIRPLLEVPRCVLAVYATEHSLRWIEDESNTDSRYRRNHLRHAVLPRIEEQFPGAAQSLARAGRHFAEAARLLEELAQLDRAAVGSPAGRIEIARFNALPPARARNLLRCELLAAGLRAPEARWLDEALHQLATVGAGSQTCLSTLDGQLHVYRGELYVLAHRPAVPAVALEWRGEAELLWGADRVSFVPMVGGGISRRLLDSAPVCVRARQGGERLQPDPQRPRKSLRKLAQDAAMPSWERARLPLLWCGERLAWVGGLGVDAAFACPPGEVGVALSWIRAEGLPTVGHSRAAG